MLPLNQNTSNRTKQLCYSQSKWIYLNTDIKKPRSYPKQPNNMLKRHKIWDMSCWVDISSMLATSFGHQAKLWAAAKYVAYVRRYDNLWVCVFTSNVLKIISKKDCEIVKIYGFLPFYVWKSLWTLRVGLGCWLWRQGMNWFWGWACRKEACRSWCLWW